MVWLYQVPKDQSSLALGLFVASLLQTVVLAIYAFVLHQCSALFENRRLIRHFVYSIGCKTYLTDSVYFLLFHAYGPIISTALALLVPIVLMYLRIHEITGFSRLAIRRSSLLVLILTTIMAIFVLLANWLMGVVLPDTNRLFSAFHLVIVGGVGVVVYGFLALVTRLLDKLVGSALDAVVRRIYRLNDKI